MIGRLLIASAVLVAVGGAAGPTLYVSGDNVNIRKAPSKKAQVVGKLNKGEELTERERDGKWVRVWIDRVGGRSGWVHTSLVTALPPGKRTGDPKFDRFREAVQQLNNHARSRGYDVFPKVENLRGGAVQIVATERWLSVPEPERRVQLEEFFSLWDETDGTGLPIMVRIVDGDGTVMMEKARRFSQR